MRNLLARPVAGVRRAVRRVRGPGQGVLGVACISGGVWGIFGASVAAIVLGCFLVLAAAMDAR